MDLKDIEQAVEQGNSNSLTFLTGDDAGSEYLILEHIYALLNTKGGEIIIGTNQSKKINGLPRSKGKSIIDKLKLLLKKESDNTIKVDIENIPIQNNKCVVIFKVPEGSDKPYFTSYSKILVKVNHKLQSVASKELLMNLFFSDYKEYKEAMENNDFNSLPRNVRDLIKVMEQAMSRGKLMRLCDRKDAGNFNDNYLKPALENGIIAKTEPDKPTSPNQEYYLTPKGSVLKMKLKRNM